MADKKISQMTTASTLSSESFFALIQAGDNYKIQRDNLKTEILYEDSKDLTIENASPTNNIVLKLGDISGTTKITIVDSTDTMTAYIDSDGIFVNSIGLDGVLEAKNASDISKVKFNSNGDSYIIGGNVGLGINSPLAQFHNAGGEIENVTDINTMSYSVLNTDRNVDVYYTATGSVTISLSSALALLPGFIIDISDAGENAGTNNITITTEGTETINGLSTYVINGDGGSVTLVARSDGNWKIK